MSVEATAIAPQLPKFDVAFLDMDGVLADFQGSACKAHNRDMRALINNNYWPVGSWDMPKAMGMTREKFWQVIDELPNFWHDMPKLPYCNDILKIARSIAPCVRVLSTPHNHDNSYAGKRDWCRQHLPGIKITLNEDEPGQSSKALLAKPGRLLIDDSDKNVDAFRAAGGSAILIPQHWNSAHDKAPYGVLFYLAMELEKLRLEQERKAEWKRQKHEGDDLRRAFRENPLVPVKATADDHSIGTQDTSDAIGDGNDTWEPPTGKPSEPPLPSIAASMAARSDPW